MPRAAIGGGKRFAERSRAVCVQEVEKCRFETEKVRPRTVCEPPVHLVHAVAALASTMCAVWDPWDLQIDLQRGPKDEYP